MPKDYYAVLGVSRSTNSAAIHSAFRALARRYHPDTGRESSSVKFREAFEAYQALSDPASRRRHDVELSEVMSSPKAIAEPLFDPELASRGPVTSLHSALDEITAEILRLLQCEF